MLAAVLVPVYWVMMSIAAVKAMWQLVVTPSFWEKTAHGLDSDVEDPDAEDPDAAKPEARFVVTAAGADPDRSAVSGSARPLGECAGTVGPTVSNAN